jgi:hypothetical protein
MSRGTGAGLAVVLAAVLAVVGCGVTREAGAMPSPKVTSVPSPGPSGGSPSDPGQPSAESTAPPLSTTDLPTMGPLKPPKSPTDLVPTNMIAGRVIRGGSGPCYGVVTEDETEFAVYSTAGLSLRKGAHVRIRFESLKLRIDCGAGRPIRALEITVLN